ncbi:hypothetical protein Goarm_020469, partial [Gossypium armourianum]|nr:hypothetical protein [Gossypium armourianum]
MIVGSAYVVGIIMRYWSDKNVQVYTIVSGNKVTSKCRVIVPI